MRRLPFPTALRAGFTLVELMTVVVILGIVTAAMVPAMRGTMAEEELGEAARSLAAAIRIAHSTSVTQNRPARLRLDTGQARYQVEMLIEEEGKPVTRPVPRPEAAGKWNRIIQVRVEQGGQAEDTEDADNPESALSTGLDQPEEVPSTETQDLTSIRFFPDGTADSRRLIFRDRDGFGLRMDVHPVTGRVSTQRLEREP